MTTDDYTIDILNNGKKIVLTNKSFIENSEIYIPLRETFEKIGVMDNDKSYIIWDNGKITVSINDPQRSVNGYSEFTYQIEIGSKTQKIISNPEPVNFTAEIDPPVLKNGTAYVTRACAAVILQEIYGINLYKLGYQIYDKNGEIIEAESNPTLATAVKVSKYPNNSPEYIIDQFFYLFNTKDIYNMKKYYTKPIVIRQLETVFVPQEIISNITFDYTQDGTNQMYAKFYTKLKSNANEVWRWKIFLKQQST